MILNLNELGTTNILPNDAKAQVKSAIRILEEQLYTYNQEFDAKTINHLFCCVASLTKSLLDEG